MDWIMQIEVSFTLFLQGLGGWLEFPMQVFTFLGNELFFLLIMPALYWCIDPVLGFRAGIMLILSGGLNSCFKILFHSPRPFWVDSRVKAMTSEVSFGLPSGHSQNSAAIWGMLAASEKKKWTTIIILIIVFFIGLSRIYLGMHFVRDVLAGWLVGGLIILLYLKLEKPIAAWLAHKSLGLQILLSLLFSLTLIGLGYLSLASANGFVLPETWINQAVASGAEKPDPFSMEGVFTIAGVGFGFLAGFAWYRYKFGVYEIKCSGLKRLARYALGLLGIVTLYFGLKIIFPDEPLIVGAVFRFVRYGLIGLWVTMIAPLLFKVFKLDR